jgi:hypothetical protein
VAQTPADPFAFFGPEVVVSARDRQAIDRGEPLARVLPGQDREIAVFAAVSVKVDGDRLAAWVRDIAALKKSAFVLSIGRFSNPPRIEDLDGLLLDDEDLDAIPRCRPGDCKLKLSAPEIAMLQGAVRDRASDQRPALQEAFRRVVLERVRRYLAGGHPALGPNSDRDSPVPLQTAFTSIIRRSVYLTARVPDFADYLDRYPQVSMPDVESFVYWSKEQLAGKPIVSATHVSILRGRNGSVPEALVAGKQVFATHYMNASLNLTALMRGNPGSPNYLVYLNRSDVDVLGGFFGGLVRLIAERRVKSEASEVLEGLGHRLESGEPPAR